MNTMCAKRYVYNPEQSAITVMLDGRSRLPSEFVWRGRRYSISAVQDYWRAVGAWWDGEGERTFFRTLIQGGGIFEICYDHMKREWRLHRIED
jgi:hypothetical protein